MNLSEKILAIYPALAPQDFISGLIFLRNDSDGRGDYIETWDHPTLSQPTQGQLDAIVEPPPQSKTQFSVLEFRDRFTIAEQIDIRQAQFADMEVGLVYDAFISAQFIDVTDPRVEQGIDLYISKGLLEPDRKEALLAPELIPPTEAA